MKNKHTPRVCMLQPYLTPYRLGLFNALSDRLNGQLTILYFSKEEEARKWTFDRNIRFCEIFLKNKIKRIGYENNRVDMSFIGLGIAIIRLKPDVVIGGDGPQAKKLRIWQQLLRFKMLYWTEMNEVVLRNIRPREWVMQWLDRGVSSYVIPGKLSERYLRKIRGYKGPVYFAPNTIDRARFACSARDVVEKFQTDGELRLLFSGNLIPRKGFDFLLDAFEQLADAECPAYRLDVIGDGLLEKRTVKNVYYHGFLEQDECARFMRQAHVFVLPSLWDCNPLVVAEAATAGCVTILSDGVGNYPEYTDGNGLVFERGNAEALYNALLKVLRMNRDELLQMALRSIEIASQVSHENSADVFIKAIEECGGLENR